MPAPLEVTTVRGNMQVHNADIAAIFTEIAALLEIEGENPFRVRAYRNAARTLGELGRSVQTMIAQGEDLKSVPGVGADLDAKIREIVTTGSCALLQRLRRTLPPAIAELLQIPGLGPKRVRTLHEALAVDTQEQLARAAREGRIRKLPGFGVKTEAHILESIEANLNKSRRFNLAIAEQYAEPLLAWLHAAPGVDRVHPAGSLRRMRETVGDLDILVTAHDAAAVIRRFTQYEELTSSSL
jgi:DNA polymerase (family 10)